MDNTITSKLLIIINNQHALINILKSMESRLSTIEEALNNPMPKSVPNNDDEDEEILFKPNKKH